MTPEENLILYLTNDNSYKKAEFSISAFGTFIKNYVASKIDSDHKVASVLAILTPALLSTAGFPMLAFFIRTAEYVFGFNLTDIFSKIGSMLSPMLSKEEPITNDKIKSIVSSSVGHTAEASFDNVELIKNANTLIKTAKLTKSIVGSGLSALLSWVVKAVLVAAGFSVGADIVKKTVGLENDIDRAKNPEQYEKEHPKASSKVSTTPVGNLTLNPSYSIENNNVNSSWVEDISPSNIANKLYEYAYTVYPELKDYKSQILSNPKFNFLVDEIKKYNSRGSNSYTYIPSEFNSKKEIVDLFAADIAKQINNKA